MLNLVPLSIGIAVSIIVLVAIFSIFPQLIGTFACPDPADYENDAGAAAWATSCENLKTQTAVVPVLITLAVVISAILIVTRLFGA
jgi:hypothetical protein